MIDAFIDSEDDDDGNFYDKVASDEEYSLLNHQEQQKRMKAHKRSKKVDLINSSLMKREFFDQFQSTKEHPTNGSGPNEVMRTMDLILQHGIRLL